MHRVGVSAIRQHTLPGTLVTKRDAGPKDAVEETCARVLLSSSSFDLLRTDQKVSRNFPHLADLVDHLDCECAPT
jgi:hypothetical protein